MEIDKTTLKDLSVFDHDEEFSIFQKLDFTLTAGGKEKLRYIFSKPLNTPEEINDIQHTLKLIIKNKEAWPQTVSNGTMIMVQQFYQGNIDTIPNHPSAASAYSYKIFHGPDFSLVKYSTGHCFDFIKGMRELINTLLHADISLSLKKLLKKAEGIINKEQFNIISKKTKPDDLAITEMLKLAHFLLYHFKQNIFELMDIYYQLDAWYSMAMAIDKYGLVFPLFIESNEPILQTKELYHILLPEPVGYNITLRPANNFIFLTGANMAGKSTFIKSVGAAVFLAHIGMGVPAQAMELSLFDGLLSNINVTDNITKGESYFYNEVQRIKNTIVKINDGRKWLILIDELFKGTNVQDAMKCSATVIEGLIKIKSSLFILSTHLYEIAEELKVYPNIAFKYFETIVDEDQFKFNYRLKDGISNDRLGYLILKRENVIELLEKL
ncbi:MAG: DNA mismatch repair protein MutS [Ginsengibacter sp.]